MLAWEGETVKMDTDVLENLMVLMKTIECILELYESVISELQESTKCADDILWNMALEGW